MTSHQVKQIQKEAKFYQMGKFLNDMDQYLVSRVKFDPSTLEMRSILSQRDCEITSDDCIFGCLDYILNLENIKRCNDPFRYCFSAQIKYGIDFGSFSFGWSKLDEDKWNYINITNENVKVMDTFILWLNYEKNALNLIQIPENSLEPPLLRESRRFEVKEGEEWSAYVQVTRNDNMFNTALRINNNTHRFREIVKTFY